MFEGTGGPEIYSGLMEKAATSANEEINLLALVRTIWLGRWLLVTVTAGSTLIGVAYALLAPEWYRAEVVLAPADQQSYAGGALAGLAGLGGLASLAGINLPNPGPQQPVAVLESNAFARAFIEDQGLMPVLLSEVSSTDPLDIRDAVRFFDTRVRAVSEDRRTSLVRLSIRWRDAETAAAWANGLAKLLNDRLRQQAEEEAERNVTYLKKEMVATVIVSLQQSLGSLLEAEMQKLMLARGNEEFAFKVIDDAVAPKRPDSPKRALIVVVAFFAGAVLSVMILIVRGAIRSASGT